MCERSPLGLDQADDFLTSWGNASVYRLINQSELPSVLTLVFVFHW